MLADPFPESDWQKLRDVREEALNRLSVLCHQGKLQDARGVLRACEGSGSTE